MSHAVLRGEPYSSQLYLDTILDDIREVRRAAGRRPGERAEINLAEIIFHVMKHNLKRTYMIDGSTNETVTNENILKLSVSLARALIARGAKGKHVLLVVNNHKNMAAIYYACLLAGVQPLYIEPNSSLRELIHFITLLNPHMIFCENSRHQIMLEAAPHTTIVVIDDDQQFLDFRGSHSEDLDSFQVSDTSIHSTALMLPTSGSSGFPKATVLSHGGLVAHLPVLWLFHSRFPQPSRLALLLSTAQWMTCTIIMLTCPVYGVPILMTKQKGSEHVLSIVEKYRPTWTIIGPGFAKNIAELATAGQLHSLETVICTGAPITTNTREYLQGKLSEGTDIANGIGATELQGFFAVPKKGTTPQCNGHIFNIFTYKLMDEMDNEVGPNQRGELCIKSELCIFKGYLNNEEAYKECMRPGGWYYTGDVFYENEQREIYFVERKKFWFKYMNYQIAPEELEQVIGTVPGVQEVVVCGSQAGPAALVVLQHQIDSPHLVREQIQSMVQSTLSDYKRLRGGIAFVDAIPCTPNGKLKRSECAVVLDNLIASGQCH